MTDFRTVMERHGWGKLPSVAAIKPSPILAVHTQRHIVIRPGRYTVKRDYGECQEYSLAKRRTWT